MCQSVLTNVVKYAEKFCQLKYFSVCLEQLEITCNFTTFNTFAHDKRIRQ